MNSLTYASICLFRSEPFPINELVSGLTNRLPESCGLRKYRYAILLIVACILET